MRRASTAAAAAAVIGLVLLAAAVPVVAPPASAGGGSMLVPDRDHYEPGDSVHLVAEVRKHDLDWFGPYTVSLRPLASTGTLARPGEDPTDTVVGRLVVTRIDPTFVRAEVTFVLPKLADGEYWVQHCNPGCTKNLGDLSSGLLRVGPPPPPTTTAPASVSPTTRAALPVDAPPTTIATSAVAPTSASTIPPDRTAAAVAEGDETAWPPIALGAAAAVLVVIAIGLLARRRGPRRVVTSRSTLDRGTVDGGDRPDAVVAVALEPEPQRPDGADAASTIGSAR